MSWPYFVRNSSWLNNRSEERFKASIMFCCIVSLQPSTSAVPYHTWAHKNAWPQVRFPRTARVSLHPLMFSPSFSKLSSSSATSILDFINLFKLHIVTAGNFKPSVGVSCQIAVFIGLERYFCMLLEKRNKKMEAELQRKINQITRLAMESWLSKTYFSPWSVVVQANASHLA